ncbi:DUF4350 domain-containing protein [Pseudomarimonas arenosa]|uniref:DUF4350 domain-containing protein n=1 Tax=Pseudomarimonas arenosa TaxID=2774145 RepID=A0AAW3ZJ82_9GAMM|nr:DUF4350 domain-containing protein [Pseudomarimonas arenosa]MBD8525500.1 hypothetical protein [Pseudomarimonas arenosa]
MSRAQTIVGLCLLLLTAVAVFAFLQTYHYVEEEVSLPPRGEARYNPLYALGETLRGMGYPVESRAYLQWESMQPQPGDVLLLASPLSSLSEQQVWALQEWLYEGGFLLFAAPATESAQQSEMLDELGLSVISEELRQCLLWRAAEQASSEVCSELSLYYPHDDLIWALDYQRRSRAEIEALRELLDDEDTSISSVSKVRGAAAATGRFAVKAAYGDGEWIALASFQPLVKKALENAANAELAWQLLAPWLGEGKIHIVYAVEMPPAHVILVRYGWPVVLPLLLALLAWLWARSQSLGPPVPLPGIDRRALLEHIDAAGQFAFREQQVEPLYAECRKRFDLQLQKEHPSLAALPLDDLIKALAERWKLDPAAVAQALNPHQLGRAEQFTLAIRTLTQMQGLS